MKKQTNVDKYVDHYFAYISGEHKDNQFARDKLGRFIKEKMDSGLSGGNLIKSLSVNVDKVDQFISDESDKVPISKSADNLIKEGKTYLHSQLFEPIEAIRCYQDEDGNTVWENLDDYSGPKLRFKYTLQDLLEYYYKKLRVPDYLRNESGDKGALNFMVNKHGIDLVLFCIDAASGIAEDDDIVPDNPFYIHKCLQDGLERYNYKLNMLVQAGVDVNIETSNRS